MKKDKLVIAENGNEVKIYDVTQLGHTLSQTITFTNAMWRKTHLDYDEKENQYYLTIWSPSDSCVLVYEEDGSSFSLKIELEFNNTQVNYASVSAKL